ncbi:MAG: arylsulfotransferase family protein, partial [Deltaproteobacteria bacterium]
HLNKIAELKSDIASDFPMFNAGDLLLSLRQYNLRFVVDPNSWTIKWWKIGPWIRQHDPEFIPGGKIIMLNNNCYRKAYDEYPSELDIPRVSNILEYDPLKDKSTILYSGEDDQGFLTVIRGTDEFLPNGNIFITEFEGGRAFEADKEGHIIWEYINRYDQNEVAEITEGHIYQADYFDVTDWSCGENSER